MGERIASTTNEKIYTSLISSMKDKNSKVDINGTNFLIGTNLAEDTIPNSSVGRFKVRDTVDNALDSKILFGNSTNEAASGIVNGTGSGALYGAEGIANSISAVGDRVASAAKALEGYVSPVKDTLEAIHNIGKDFDESIKDTFIGQTFKIRGQELICMMFCIIVSMLSCKTRQKIYDAMMNIRNGTDAFNSSINEISRISSESNEFPVSKDGSIAQTTASLFGNDKKTSELKETFVGDKKASKVSTSQLNVSDDVKDTISDIIKLLSILAKGQITIPTGISVNIWSIAAVVLSVLRLMMMQMVDEFLTKVVGKIEKKLKNMVPQNCVGNIGTILINKIMKVIRDVKNYLLELLKGALGDSKTFTVTWKTFGWYFKEIYELLAMLKALNLRLSKFADLVMVCGLSPCETRDTPEIANLKNSINLGKIVSVTNIRPATISKKAFTPPTDKSLNDVAKKFASINKIDPNNVFVGNDTLTVVTPNAFKGAPRMILEIINTPEFLAELGSDYTIYNPDDQSSITNNQNLNIANTNNNTNNNTNTDSSIRDGLSDSGITVTYTFKRMCS